MCLDRLTHGRKLSPPRRAPLHLPAFHPPFFRRCIAQQVRLALQAIVWEVSTSKLFPGPSVQHPAGCNNKPPGSPENKHQLHFQGRELLLCYTLVSSISPPVPTGTGCTGILYSESSLETWTSSTYTQGNKGNVAQCTLRQNIRAAGPARAKSPPRPASCLQWPNADP